MSNVTIIFLSSQIFAHMNTIQKIEYTTPIVVRQPTTFYTKTWEGDDFAHHCSLILTTANKIHHAI